MDTYIQQTLVFIGSAIVLVPIFKKLGFGSVLGYLIAGILVGPYGLKLIGDSESVMHFAELGVVLLLFMIGLEIQPFKLWSMRRHLLGLGGTQIALSTLIFTIVTYLFGCPLHIALVIGFSLSLSSTAFALQTLTERNQFNTEFGRASFGILLMQDIVAIPALAVIPVLAGANEAGNQPWQKMIAFGAIVIGLFIMSRYAMRWIFRLIVNMRIREIFTATALFIVLGVAVLMQKIGLSAALGTFIAGVLLAESEYRHEIEANLEPFKNLFMGLFFIAVGMGVSLDLIVQKPLIIVGLALGYLIAKGLVIYFVGRLFNMNHEGSKLMGLQIAQGGEFAFVIFGMMIAFQLASEETISLLTAVITLSMMINPIFMMLNERWSKCKPPETTKPTYDNIPDQSPQVIIAGFGRFGQIFGRVMRAQGIPFIAIEQDPEQIELLRKFGSKVYYGDASRVDLLESAGAAKAKYFIVAVDNMETSMEIVRTLKKEFPQLKIFARARNRGHVFDLMDEGVQHIKRETFDSSVYFVRDFLEELGFSHEKAKSIVKRFKRHDELMMEEQYKVRHDDEMFVSLSKQATAQLAQVLSNDSERTYVDAKVVHAED